MIDNSFIKKYSTLPIACYEADFLCGNKNSTQNTIHTSLHKHSELEILYVREGNAYMCIDCTRYELHKGDILLINPLEVHYGEYYNNQNQYSYFCLDFDLSMCKINAAENTPVKSMKIENYIPKNHPQNKALLTLLNDIFTSLHDKRDGWEWRISGDILIFNAIILENNLLTAKSQNPRDTKNNILINKIFDYIEKNYDKNITSQDMAKALSYNHCYFCRVFKSIFNKSFCEYINIYRLCKAKEHLGSSAKPITQISISVGFNSCSYFSKLFKDYFGISPTRYRKMYSHKSSADRIKQNSGVLLI